MIKHFPLLLSLVLAAALGRAAENYRLDPTNSVIRIHLGTAGFLGSIGHAHLIEAPLQEGRFIYAPDDPAGSLVELVVATGRMQVRDPKISVRDKREIQATMESERVLGVKQFPSITFKSTSVQADGTNRLVVLGDLTIRGQTRLVTVNAVLGQTKPGLRVTGQSHIRQTDFGIKPVSVGMGTVKVQDQVTISFDVVGQPGP